MAMSPKVLIQRISGQYWQHSGDGVDEGGGVGKGRWRWVMEWGREGVVRGGWGW